MYITTRCLCFYSNLFGMEKKLRIPFPHIVTIQKKKTALVIDNAIFVTTSRVTYQFRSFWDRDECFQILEAVIERSRVEAESQRVLASALDETSVTDEKELLRRRSLSLTNVPHTSAAGYRPLVEELEMVVEEEEGRPANRGSMESVDDPVVCFEAAVRRSGLRIPVVTADPLPLSLDEFFAQFVADDAPHSWAQYHGLAGDTNVVATRWERCEGETELRRQIKFFKPVNLPGLKSTRGIKHQRYRLFPGVGCIVCSSTWLEDVPAAKSFSVDDVLVVKAVGERVEICISFEVKFLQSTMFKFVIESGTNAEMFKWLTAFASYLKKVAHGEQLLSPISPATPATVCAEELYSSKTGAVATGIIGWMEQWYRPAVLLLLLLLVLEGLCILFAINANCSRRLDVLERFLDLLIQKLPELRREGEELEW